MNKYESSIQLSNQGKSITPRNSAFETGDKGTYSYSENKINISYLRVKQVINVAPVIIIRVTLYRTCNQLKQLQLYLYTFHVTLQAHEPEGCIGFDSLQESQHLLEISESIPDEGITIPTLVVQGIYT